MQTNADGIRSSKWDRFLRHITPFVVAKIVKGKHYTFGPKTCKNSHQTNTIHMQRSWRGSKDSLPRMTEISGADGHVYYTGTTELSEC